MMYPHAGSLRQPQDWALGAGVTARPDRLRRHADGFGDNHFHSPPWSLQTLASSGRMVAIGYRQPRKRMSALLQRSYNVRWMPIRNFRLTPPEIEGARSEERSVCEFLSRRFLGVSSMVQTHRPARARQRDAQMVEPVHCALMSLRHAIAFGGLNARQ
jgi:hypothetical protein